MKLSHLLVGSALLACAGVAQAAVIPVANGSFETVGTGGVPWYALPDPGAWSGPVGPYDVYDIGIPEHFSNAPDGVRVANLGAAGVITQTLSYTVVAGDVFTLDFYVGKGQAGNSGGSGDLTASILVGTTTIGTDATIATGDVTGNTTNTWYHKTVTGTATGTGALSISFAPNATAGGSPWLDNVTMTVVPEPASLGLLSMAGLALMRRRR